MKKKETIKDIDHLHQERRKKTYNQFGCGGGFTPALSTSWQVWTKTSVGGVFTISLLMVRRLAEVTICS